MLAELAPVQIATVAGIVFAAFVIRGMSGFGAGMIGVPLLAFLMPVHTAVAMFGLMVLVLFVFLSIRDWGTVVKEELKLLLLPTLLGVAGGILVFKHVDNRLLVQLLGGFLVAYSLYALAVSFFGLPPFSCSRRWAFPLGFAGAVMIRCHQSAASFTLTMFSRITGQNSAPLLSKASSSNRCFTLSHS